MNSLTRKIIKQSEWESWRVLAEPTFTSAQVRQDPDTGKAWSWLSAGKRVEIERRPYFDSKGF